MARQKLIVFTKHFKDLSVGELVKALKSAGVDGADLCVRKGHPVEPGTAGKELPKAVKKFKDAGLYIPLITTEDFDDPKNPGVEKLMAACGENGVGLIKLSYWDMEEGGYWKTVEKIRSLLEKFVKLAEKHGVKLVIHNHSGLTMGLNSSSVMNLVKGFDPRYVGVFADTGHLSLVGEPLPMALDIVKEYIAALAVKDLVRERAVVDGKRRWQTRVVPLGEGFTDWQALSPTLRKINFKGVISLHSEYGNLPVESLIDQVRMDVRFFRKVLDEGGKKK